MNSKLNRLTLILMTTSLLLTMFPAVSASLLKPEIESLRLGKDKNVTEETDEFGRQDTIYAVASIVNNPRTVKVVGVLIAVEIPGVKPGPIPGLEVVVTVTGKGEAHFSFSKPTAGWPKGEYEFEATILDANDEALDEESVSFIVK